MPKTIGNPLSWGADAVGETGHHLADASGKITGERSAAEPVIRTIKTADLREAVRAGAADFAALRSDVLFSVALYPVIGLILTLFAFNADLAPFIFPLAAGFALIGPLGAVGLYELSRRREKGMNPTWSDGFALLRSPALGPIITLGLGLLAVFLIWMMVARVIFALTMGSIPMEATTDFFRAIFTTPGGWAMILVGIPVGFVFAAIVLTTTIVSFPMLIDRDIGVRKAVSSSIALSRKNPRVIATWGLLVAAALVVGTIPLFLGLIIVLPVLGHATWHLYRKAIG